MGRWQTTPGPTGFGCFRCHAAAIVEIGCIRSLFTKVVWPCAQVFGQHGLGTPASRLYLDSSDSLHISGHPGRHNGLRSAANHNDNGLPPRWPGRDVRKSCGRLLVFSTVGVRSQGVQGDPHIVTAHILHGNSWQDGTPDGVDGLVSPWTRMEVPGAQQQTLYSACHVP